MSSSITSKQSIAVFVNGHMDYTPKLAKRVNQFTSVILVDGGANHFYELSKKFEMNTPKLITGDLDSISKQVLRHYEELRVEVKKLDRAKDKTDLEDALDTLDISQYAETVIFGGLGGRVDHTLGNLFLLLRYPAQKLFFETENERISLLDGAQCSSYTFEKNSTYQYLSFFSFYNPPTNITLEDNHSLKTSTSLSLKESLNGIEHLLTDKNSITTLSIESGQLLCVQHLTSSPSDSSIFQTFSLLNQAFESESTFTHDNKSYKILKPSEQYSFISKIGETVSLIPLFGPAKGIKTQGLKWELGENFGVLDKNFIGISNVTMKETCKISVEAGYLICIINHDLIDVDMVSREKPAY